jgi:hypothetical protein
MLERLIKRLCPFGHPGNLGMRQDTLVDPRIVNHASKEPVHVGSAYADRHVRIFRDVPDILRIDRVGTLAVFATVYVELSPRRLHFGTFSDGYGDMMPFAIINNRSASESAIAMLSSQSAIIDAEILVLTTDTCTIAATPADQRTAINVRRINPAGDAEG